MQNDIPWDLLPKMFRDVIFLANILDVPYIWIDALCIVQDHPSDRDEQASRMSSIFSCSLLALAATAAEDSNSDCFTLLDSNFGQRHLQDERAGGRASRQAHRLYRHRG